MTQPTHPDPDARKGATEDTAPNAPCPDHAHPGQAHDRLANQLPHRESDPRADSLIKDSDSDFPEPGPSPEHT